MHRVELKRVLLGFFSYFDCKESKASMETNFMRVKEVADYMSISVPMAYKVIRRLNDELEGRGFITVAGRVNRNYFVAKVSGSLPA